LKSSKNKRVVQTDNSTLKTKRKSELLFGGSIDLLGTRRLGWKPLYAMNLIRRNHK